jgi:hypothetical protein
MSALGVPGPESERESGGADPCLRGKILGMKPADERMGTGVLVSAPGVGVDGDIGKLSSGGGGLR